MFHLVAHARANTPLFVDWQAGRALWDILVTALLPREACGLSAGLAAQHLPGPHGAGRGTDRPPALAPEDARVLLRLAADWRAPGLHEPDPRLMAWRSRRRS